jgi:hypothetical protein
VHPTLENVAACWEPYKEGEMNTLDWLQKKPAKFAHCTNTPSWEILAQRRKIGALFKAYTEERAMKDIGDGLQKPFYLNRVHQDGKISSRKQNTKERYRKYSIVNRTIALWNKLPEQFSGTHFY